MTLGVGALMLGRGHISHYSGFVLSSTLSIYLYTLIAVVLKDAVLLYTIVDIYLLYEGAVCMQILALLTRIKCKVSNTQVIDKACGPLVYSNWGRT